jgi:hypothetical protein
VKITGRQLLAAIVSLVVLAVIVTSVVMLGSPSEERARRVDQRRVLELEGVKSAVNYFYEKKGHLPASLDELSNEPGVHISNDPVTGKAYGYRTVSAREFELCGTFDRDSLPARGSGVDVWQHTAGEHCVTLEVYLREAK